MQIVSHMDSRDKHRVRGCCVLGGGLKGGPCLYPMQGGGLTTKWVWPSACSRGSADSNAG